MPEIAAELVIFRCALIVALGYLSFHLGRRGIKRLAAGAGLSSNATFLLTAVLRWIVAVVVVVLLVQAFGVSVHSLWTALSTLMVMVAIGFVAMWSVLSNLLCAVLLVVFAPFRIGDEIELIEITMTDADKHGIHGRVVAINMLYTLLEDLSPDGGGIIRVPNNLLFQRAIRTVEGADTRSLGNALFKHDDHA